MGQRREAELHSSLGLVVYSGQRGKTDTEAWSRSFSLVHCTAGSQCEAVTSREHDGGSGGQFLAKVTAGEGKRPPSYWQLQLHKPSNINKGQNGHEQ